MTNDLFEKRSYKIIIAAVISSLVIMAVGLGVGLAYAVREHERAEVDDRAMAGHLLEEAAYELRGSMSALRLCNDAEPVQRISRTALVHAVRAETALECKGEDWADSRDKEAFLNDLTTVLQSFSPSEVIKLSQKLYKLSDAFYSCVSSGGAFEYKGELVPAHTEHETEATEDDISDAGERVKTALGAESATYAGAWGGHIEFNTERDGMRGYAVVCKENIIEFAFERGKSAAEQDEAAAQKLALRAARDCGYNDLSVSRCTAANGAVSVVMCRSYSGALACDDCATAVVRGNKVIAFSAGKCDERHANIPTAKKSETEARFAAGADAGNGSLVVRKVDGRERICYEYRFELEDGPHCVYVCAESGKQMEVK